MPDFFLITLLFASPILIAAVGGMICERAGIVNIALEGLMTIGAMTAAAAHVLLETRIGFSVPLALIFAALAGGLFSLILAFTSVTMKANQLISGMGINFLCIGLALFFCQVLFRMDRSMSFRSGMQPFFLGINLSVLIAVTVFTLYWFVLRKRSGSFHLCVDGENPQALTAASRYIAILISGFLSGLAGACVVLTLDTQFTVNTINGKGFIALGAVYLGRKISFILTARKNGSNL